MFGENLKIIHIKNVVYLGNVYFTSRVCVCVCVWLWLRRVSCWYTDHRTAAVLLQSICYKYLIFLLSLTAPEQWKYKKAKTAPPSKKSHFAKRGYKNDIYLQQCRLLLKIKDSEWVLDLLANPSKLIIKEKISFLLSIGIRSLPSQPEKRTELKYSI